MGGSMGVAALGEVGVWMSGTELPVCSLLLREEIIMETVLVSPKTPEELASLEAYLLREHIASRVLSEEDKEDAALLMLMSAVDREDIVSEMEVMKILKR